MIDTNFAGKYSWRKRRLKSHFYSADCFSWLPGYGYEDSSNQPIYAPTLKSVHAKYNLCGCTRKGWGVAGKLDFSR